MITKKYSIGLLFFTITYLILISNLWASINQTILIKVEAGKSVYTDFHEQKITIAANQKVKFYFTADNFDAKGLIQYKIFQDEKIIADSLTSNFFESDYLVRGKYRFKIQAFSGIEYEAIPFEITIEASDSLVDSDDKSDFIFSKVNLIIAAFALFMFVAVIYLSIKLRGSKKTIDTVSTNETDELKRKLSEYKINLDKKTKEIKHLQKVISGLNKTIEKLEEANVNLIEQKETLHSKKIQLEELQKKKDELLAIKFHDIKNPANAIHGLVELLESYDLTASEQQEIMESLVASSEAIVELVQNISETFAKESFEEEYVFEEALIQDIIASVITINSAYAKKKGIRLINNSSKSLPKFKFDQLKIKEAIDNLINNAIKYSPMNTDVSIRTFMTEKNIYIEVSDNGVGISEKELPLIFEKGIKLSPKPTGNEKSSGLGMWIVKKIIDAHKGKIEAKSKIGLGSTFTIELPKN